MLEATTHGFNLPPGLVRAGIPTSKGMSFLFENEVLSNSIDTRIIEAMKQAYYIASDRFVSLALGLDPTHYFRNSYPTARVLVTQNKSLLFSLYPNQDRVKDLPPWVPGFTNPSLKLWVRLINPTDPVIIDLDGMAHEFTHIIIPELLGIPPEIYYQIRPEWVDEGMPVNLNEKRSKKWIKEQLKEGSVIPNLREIETNGIFAHDQRKPADNPWYQYCAYATETLGEEAIPLLPTSPKQPALGYVCDLLVMAYKRGLTLVETANQLGIDMKQVENITREKLGLAKII